MRWGRAVLERTGILPPGESACRRAGETGPGFGFREFVIPLTPMANRLRYIAAITRKDSTMSCDLQRDALLVEKGPGSNCLRKGPGSNCLIIHDESGVDVADE